jgi:hypothetical protein
MFAGAGSTLSANATNCNEDQVLRCGHGCPLRDDGVRRNHGPRLKFGQKSAHGANHMTSTGGTLIGGLNSLLPNVADGPNAPQSPQDIHVRGNVCKCSLTCLRGPATTLWVPFA